MSTPSPTTTTSQSKIFQRTYSTLKDFVQSKWPYLVRIEQNMGNLFTDEALFRTQSGHNRDPFDKAFARQYERKRRGDKGCRTIQWNRTVIFLR